MNFIKIDLPRDLKQVEVHAFADEHIGDNNCDIDRLKERIQYVAETPAAYCILNGDIIDNATKTSIGDCYANEFNPMLQLKVAVQLFEPIKDKILCITHGNHENRTYRREGINLSYLLAAQLGLLERFTETSAVLFLRVGETGKSDHGKGVNRQICYTFYIIHGGGGGRKEGAKAIRLADMASIIDVDVYMHGHTHLPMVMKQGFFRIDRQNNMAKKVDKLFVNTASNLNYGGYGEAAEFKPNSKESPVVYLSGTKKHFSARL